MVEFELNQKDLRLLISENLFQGCILLHFLDIFQSHGVPSILNMVLYMEFCYQNCSDLLWEKIVLVI